MDFGGKVALVTGGAGGIGRAACVGFAGGARASSWSTATRPAARRRRGSCGKPAATKRASCRPT